MVMCACGKAMQPIGVEEGTTDAWLVRFSCGHCARSVAVEATPEEVAGLVQRTLWTDEARHVLDRMPPYLSALVWPEVEDYARTHQRRVISAAVMAEARHQGAAAWDREAEERLSKIPAAVRAMAKMELERTAADRGESQVTVALMEEVKARYFGLFGKE
jgi:hypothetical protein